MQALAHADGCDDYEAVLQKRIARPLGLADTAVKVPAASGPWRTAARSASPDLTVRLRQAMNSLTNAWACSGNWSLAPFSSAAIAAAAATAGIVAARIRVLGPGFEIGRHDDSNPFFPGGNATVSWFQIVVVILVIVGPLVAVGSLVVRIAGMDRVLVFVRSVRNVMSGDIIVVQ